MHKTKKGAISLFLALIMALSLFVGAIPAASAANQTSMLAVTINPYENVDWATFGQYKSALHSHSTDSDGSQTKTQMIEQHYTQGYDIYAPADHDVLTRDFTSTARTYAAFLSGANDGRGSMAAERVAEIATGTGRGGKGMIAVPNTNEHSRTEHINGFFAPLLIESTNAISGNGTSVGARMMETVRLIDEVGGISHINHSGRWTGGSSSNLTTGEAASNNAANIKVHTDIFFRYPSCVGMEIINRLDNESRSDRILWDNILKVTAPEGRLVWGFSNDDSHSTGEVGWNYHMHIMPELSAGAVRESMEAGAFFAVAPVARREGVNATLPGGGAIPSGGGGTATQYLRESATNPYPRITDITVSGGTIAITANDYDVIEWIADGVTIATGGTLNLGDYADSINSYVRAQVKSSAAIVFVQPFGISEVEIESINLVLNSSKNIVRPNEYFNISIAFPEKMESNVIKLDFTFDGSKFDFAGYTPADGATLLTREHGEGYASVMVMVTGYDMGNLGELMLKAKSGVAISSSEIATIATFVERGTAGKTIKEAVGSYIQKTNNAGTEEFVVDMIVLSNLIDAFGMTSDDPKWETVSYFDFNGNGVIDIFDITTIAQMIK